MVAKRVITAVVSLLLFIPVLYFSDTFVFPAFVAIFIVISLFEMFRCTGAKDKYALVIPLYLAGAFAPFSLRYFGGSKSYCDLVLHIFMAIVLYCFALPVVTKNKINYKDISGAVLASIYIVFSMCGLVYLRDTGNDYMYLLVFVSAWMTDTFAFFTGRAFGKHKLTSLSEKKTVEGSVGGTLFGTVAFVLFAKFAVKSELHILILTALGILMSLVSQIGDLAMSAVKRYYGIKDYGKLFPGHGGFIDRFDSVLAVSSVLTIVFAIIKCIGGRVA